MLDTLLFIPHGHCYLWKPNLVGLHLISDALISIAYYSIPCSLFYFVQKRKDIPFGSIFLLFAAFIVFCGTTHLMSIWTLWHPDYWLSGIIKVLTAGISVYTAIQLIPIIPKALDLPNPAQLEAINNKLQQEVAERQQAEEQTQRYATQLEASNRELEAFAYSVSHDLRAPLRAIDGFSQALLEDYGETFEEEAQDYFDRIRKNVARMGRLIDDLLSLSRVSRYELSFTTVNLSGLAQELMDELQASEPERQVECVIVPEAIVSADATLMRVVLTNLLQNAWKFTSHHPKARIEFDTIHQEGQPIYFVRDDGAGFDMTYTKMLFSVFQRLHNTNEFPGTGIGLATVQRAIHRHGGRVWAEGAVEQGATFYFTLSSKLDAEMRRYGDAGTRRRGDAEI